MHPRTLLAAYHCAQVWTDVLPIPTGFADGARARREIIGKVKHGRRVPSAGGGQPLLHQQWNLSSRFWIKRRSLQIFWDKIRSLGR